MYPYLVEDPTSHERFTDRWACTHLIKIIKIKINKISVPLLRGSIKRMIGSVVAVAFQIFFCAEMDINNFFYFLKIIFHISTSKRSKKYKTY